MGLSAGRFLEAAEACRDVERREWERTAFITWRVESILGALGGGEQSVAFRTYLRQWGLVDD